jgi:hypothetical protein
MEGDLNKNIKGIMYLSIEDLFNYINNNEKEKEKEYLLKGSYLEIYNENIIDLLKNFNENNNNNNKMSITSTTNILLNNNNKENIYLKLFEDIEKNEIIIKDLTEIKIDSLKKMKELITYGQSLRHISNTSMNERSSRSHAIFRIKIETIIKNENNTVIKCNNSLINFVDLAGSERVNSSNTKGINLQEGQHINKSLLTLGKVIKKLSLNEK